jgi:hypothetical protein
MKLFKRLSRYSIAEISVLVIVLIVLWAAIIPFINRRWAHSRNVTRINDVKSIAQQITSYHQKNAMYPQSLREIETIWLWTVPKDPRKIVYCSGAPWYTSGDYQYYACGWGSCTAIWPKQIYPMKHLVQIWALMELENKRWDTNAWNRRAKYWPNETSNCAANAVRWGGTLLEWVQWNRLNGTWPNVTSITTNANERDYFPRYNIIVTKEVTPEN